MKFSELGINSQLLEAIDQFGFKELTEVQEKAIPEILSGKDVTILSQTGSGKTFSFLIPFIEFLYRNEVAQNSAAILVVVPTRELAIQIAEEGNKLFANSQNNAMAIYGGTDIEKQKKELARGVSICIATPGRLIDLIERKIFPIDSIQYLVLDEADRLFDMGFYDDIEYILKVIKNRKHMILASATLSSQVVSIAQRFLKNNVQIEINAEEITVEKINQTIYHLGAYEKNRFLVNYLKKTKFQLVMVFANTITKVADLEKLLSENGFKAKGISSALTQQTRTKLIKNFREEQFNILIATDVASRGLDFDGVTHVFNYDLPEYVENYVHRIGRTARAGNEGIAISFCSEYDYDLLHRIETYIEKKLDSGEVLDEDLSEIVESAQQRQRRSNQGKTTTRAGATSSRGRDNRTSREGQPNRDKDRDYRGRGDRDRSRSRDARPHDRSQARPFDRNQTRKRPTPSKQFIADDSDLTVNSMSEEEPMVTVYKRGSYIDPVEAQRELLKLSEQTSTRPKNKILTKVKGLFGKLFSKDNEKKLENEKPKKETAQQSSDDKRFQKKAESKPTNSSPNRGSRRPSRKMDNDKSEDTNKPKSRDNASQTSSGKPRPKSANRNSNRNQNKTVRDNSKESTKNNTRDIAKNIANENEPSVEAEKPDPANPRRRRNRRK